MGDISAIRQTVWPRDTLLRLCTLFGRALCAQESSALKEVALCLNEMCQQTQHSHGGTAVEIWQHGH